MLKETFKKDYFIFWALWLQDKKWGKLVHIENHNQPFLVETRMYYLIGLSMSTCCDTNLVINGCLQILNLRAIYDSFMIQKRSRSLSTKAKCNFYDLIKIYLIMINDVNIFTIYPENFTSNLLKQDSLVPAKMSKFCI